MTRATNARVAGWAFILYIAFAFPGLVLWNRATSGEGIAAKLANVAQHETAVRLAFVLPLLGCFCALVLAVTLYSITRGADPDLAMLAMVFRIAEGVIGAVSLPRVLETLWLATARGSDAPDPAAANALGTLMLKVPTWSGDLAATFFGAGSLIFSYLFLRGRIVPVALAWLGVVASILIVVAVPLGMIRVLTGPATQVIWLPMLVFELWLAVRLIVRGAAMPREIRER